VARLFVAVWPPADVLDRLDALPRLPLAGARWTTRPQWHVTLRFLGPVDVRVATAALDHLAAAPTTAVLGPRPRRLGKSVLMVPVAGLDDLAAAVADATDGLGEPGEHPYRGHLTLARARLGSVPALDVDVEATWPVEEVALVESHLHPAGARYDTVHTVALTARRTPGRAGRR
jgi:RNA 2',3'-cyclic 3'-phosphodiesterase